MYTKIIIGLSVLFIGCSSTNENIKNNNYTQTNHSIDKHLRQNNLLESKSSYFYINIEDLEEAKKAETVTYFYANDNPSKEVENYFLEFSKQLGTKHGAIIISPNTNVKKVLHIINKISNCNTIEPIQWPVIIFEDRRKKECYPLYLQEASYSSLIKVLSIIQKSLDNKANIDKKQFTHNTKYSIHALLAEYPTIKTFEIGIFKFIDYLGDKFYN